MAFTYSGDPGASRRDAIRFLIGDTDDTDIQLNDREVDYLIEQHSSDFVAAAAGCERIAAKYARKVTKSIGDLRITYSDLQKHYRDLARDLRSRGASSASPYAGGISVSDKELVEADTDRVEPGFKIGMFDNE